MTMNKVNTKINIIVPEGYEIDKENSTFKCIKFKPVKEQEFEYVDLALPSGTLWAKTNVGAKEESDYGDYLTFEEACKYNLPTKEQMEELIRCCTWKWVKVKDKPGCLVIGRNGNTIFLPAADLGLPSQWMGPDFIGTKGFYWSSSLNSSEEAWYLSFDSDVVHRDRDSYWNELSVRKVLNVPNNTY